MSPSRFSIATFLIAAAFSATAQAPPPTPEDLQKRVQSLEAQMKSLMEEYQSQIRELKSQVEALQGTRTMTGMAAPAPSEGLLPPRPSAPPSANAMNPSISVIPDMTFSAGDDPRWKASDAFTLREVEVAFSANIDPYARAFVTLAAHKHGHSHELEERFGHDHGEGEEEEEHHGYELDVEEGYALFPALPGGFSLKVGKFYADFGRENALHTHSWSQADRPWALQAVLGGEGHGLNDVGFSLNRLLPFPWTSDITLEVTGGRTEGTFDGRRSDLAYLAAWRNYWDFTENTNLEAQVSFMAGKNAAGRTTDLWNASVTFRHKPVSSRRESFVWRTEYLEKRYGSYEEHPHGDEGTGRGEEAPNRLTLVTKGLFSYVDWQFTRGWFLGARGDWVRFPHEGMTDRGGALALTWFPTEYQKFRLQAQRYSYAGLGMRNAVVLEYGFSLGPHGAHPF
jgi:hypothetical protein